MDFGGLTDCDRLVKNDPTLVTLRIMFRKIGNRGAQALAQALQHNTVLTTLHLIWNRIETPGATALGNMLWKNRTLLELYICRNSIGDEGAIALVAGLMGANNTTKLQVLKLEQCDIGNDGATAVGNMIAINQSLVQVDLGENHIGRAGLMGLCQGLGHNNKLEVLNLRDNEIVGDATMALEMALGGDNNNNNTCLKELILSRNQCGNKGAESLGRLLRVNHSLRKLMLQHNQIGNPGAAAIANGLGHQTNNKVGGLVKLDLSSNHVGNEGAVALGQVALPTNNALQELYLYDNPVGTKGAVAFSETLQHANVTLQVLDLAPNDDDDIIDDVQEHESVMREIRYSLKLNRAGRKMLRETTAPMSVWPHLLARISHDSDLVYYFVKEKPDLFE